jgi:hypothetical protein
MGREIDEPSILHFQTFPSAGDLRAALMQSKEYRARHGRNPAPDAGAHPSQVPQPAPAPDTASDGKASRRLPRKDDDATQTIALVTWPRERQSLVLGALEAALGRPVARRGPDAGRVLVEYEDFPIGVVSRFEQAVKEDRAEDSPAGFARFASVDFLAFRSFRNRWAQPDRSTPSDPACLVVPRAAFRADPGAFLPRLLAFLEIDPGILSDGAALDRVAAGMKAWIDSQPTADVTGFRHYDAGLFALLGRLTLTREAVQKTFREVMGRAISEAAILRLQAEASLADLRQLLRNTPEYVRRYKTFTPYGQVPATDLLDPRFQQIQLAHKTLLGWPLAQVFVSQKSRVIYCPIGKVACTFLKQQMVRISDVAHAETIIAHVHQLTDTIVTGLQLSDYPQDQVRSFIDSQDYFRFAVLRDPRDRLLSAYVEKFVINRLDAGNIHHTRGVVAAVQQAEGLREPDFDRGITFRQFVTAVTAADPASLDPHWKPQSLYLAGIRYDRLYRLDQIDSVIDMLEERSGRILPRQAQNVTGSGRGVPHEGAADLLPAAILALPRISSESFFDPAIDGAISTFFAGDFALLDQTDTLSLA